MGAEQALLGLMTAKNLIDMDNEKEKQSKIEEKKRKNIEIENKKLLAKYKAMQYSRGFKGGTYRKSLDSLNGKFEDKMSNIYSTKDNTMGKINLLMKAYNKSTKLSRRKGDL